MSQARVVFSSSHLGLVPIFIYFYLFLPLSHFNKAVLDGIGKKIRNLLFIDLVSDYDYYPLCLEFCARFLTKKWY